MTNQHSGALLRGRKGKGGNKGINTCSLFVNFDILTCLIRNIMCSVLLFLYIKCFSLIDMCNVLCCANIVYVTNIHVRPLRLIFNLSLADSWHVESNISCLFDCLKNVSCDTIATFP